MGQLTPHKVQRLMAKFPWKRRKPRIPGNKGSAIKYRNSEGQLLWADPYEFAQFTDPTPALLHVAFSNEDSGRMVMYTLVTHAIAQEGRPLPSDLAKATRAGVEMIEKLLDQSELEPDDTIENQRLMDLFVATWAIACALHLP